MRTQQNIDSNIKSTSIQKMMHLLMHPVPKTPSEERVERRCFQRRLCQQFAARSCDRVFFSVPNLSSGHLCALMPTCVLGCGIMMICTYFRTFYSLLPAPRESQGLLGRCVYMHICSLSVEMDCVCKCMAEAIAMSGSQTPDLGLWSVRYRRGSWLHVGSIRECGPPTTDTGMGYSRANVS